jgi:hypothetical protein
MEKSSLKSYAISVIFKTLPEVNNIRMGENSPNLVTLLLIYQHGHLRAGKVILVKYLSFS